MRHLEWAVGVTTCDRVPVTIKASLQSLEDAGVRVDLIINDSHRLLGSYGCFQSVLQDLLRHSRTAEVIAIFQDDVAVSKNLMKVMHKSITEEIWNDKTGVVSLYCAGPYHQEKKGWHKLDPCDGAHFYGALAVLMPRRVAEMFVIDPPNPAAMTRTDFWLGEFCKKHELDVWLPSPSFVNHMGDVSSIEPNWPPEHAFYRNCKVFCEDAMEFLATDDPLSDVVDLHRSF